MAKSKILIVDDEPNVVIVIKDRLEAKGYETITAKDGEEALAKARSEEPDLILLDIMLPKMDGFKVCRMLKFDERYKQIPIVMLTAKATQADVKTGKETGADAYMVKPFDFDTLLMTIERLLEKKE